MRDEQRDCRPRARAGIGTHSHFSSLSLQCNLLRRRVRVFYRPAGIDHGSRACEQGRISRKRAENMNVENK